jgi:Bacterial SH3 domain
MGFLQVRAVVWSFCLFTSVVLLAQQATVNHGVSLRGDPSTKNPEIGHLKRNSTVTLLATKPKAGFYHVQTADGQEGWVGVKYLTIEGQAGTQPTPGPTPGASNPVATSTGCDSTLWTHVYHQTRLHVIQPCTTVTGTLHIVRPEPDGDVHMQLTLDPQFSSMLNAINKTKQKGALVIETMCAHTPTQADAVASCQGFTQKFPALTEGAHIKVTGSYVLDSDPGHGWNEIHPITAVGILP